MSEVVFATSLIWGFVAIVWLIIQANMLSIKQSEFVSYRLYHQKIIALYIESSRHNRAIVTQNQRLKHAIADHVFQPNNWSLEDCVAWYNRYDIKPNLAAQEGISSKEEVEHFTDADKDATKHYKATLG